MTDECSFFSSSTGKGFASTISLTIAMKCLTLIKYNTTRALVSTAVLAYVLGLCHALDADHISVRIPSLLKRSAI